MNYIMETNPNIRQKPKSNIYQPKFPRNVPPVFKEDTGMINSLYGDFVSNDYDQLMSNINSGIILNVRNSEGKTLIHAVIDNQNPSLTEGQKLLLIKELVGKNVSVNSMDQFNRNALHYAAFKGYFDIIQYLVKLKCDITLVDNEGNTPIHLLINNFVSECKNDELLNQINKEIKVSKKSKEVEDTSSKVALSLLYKINEQVKNSENRNENFFYNCQSLMEEFISLNIFFKREEINKIFKENSESLNKKFTEIDSTNVSEVRNLKLQINQNIEKTKNDILSVYDDFKINSDFTEIDLDNSIIQEDAKEDSNTILSNANTKIEETHKLIDDIKNCLSDGIVNDSVETSLYLLNTVYYLFYLLSSTLRPINEKCVFPQELILDRFFNGRKPWNDCSSDIIFPNAEFKAPVAAVPGVPAVPAVPGVPPDADIIQYNNVHRLDTFNNPPPAAGVAVVAVVINNNSFIQALGDRKFPFPNYYDKRSKVPNPKLIYPGSQTYQVNEVGYSIQNEPTGKLLNKGNILDNSNKIFDSIKTNDFDIPKFYIRHNDYSKLSELARNQERINQLIQAVEAVKTAVAAAAAGAAAAAAAAPAAAAAGAAAAVIRNNVPRPEQIIIDAVNQVVQVANNESRKVGATAASVLTAAQNAAKRIVVDFEFILLKKDFGNLNIDRQNYNITSNTTDMSINKSLLNIILDQLEKLFEYNPPIIFERNLDRLLNNIETYEYFDLYGTVKDITNNVNENKMYSRVELQGVNDNKEIDISNGVLKKGIPLITINRKFKLNKKDSELDNKSYEVKSMYLINSPGKSEGGENQINSKNLASILEQGKYPSNDFNIDFINPNLIKSDITDFISLDTALKTRGQVRFNLENYAPRNAGGNFETPVNFPQILGVDGTGTAAFNAAAVAAGAGAGAPNPQKYSLELLFNYLNLIHPFFNSYYVPRQSLIYKGTETNQGFGLQPPPGGAPAPGAPPAAPVAAFNLINTDIQDLLFERQKELSRLINDTNFGTTDEVSKMNYLLELTVVQILEKNLPDGVLNNTNNIISEQPYNFADKRYKHGHIYTLIELINNNLDIIKESCLIKLSKDTIMKLSLDSFLVYFNQVYQLIINNMNNLELMKRYINQIDINELKNIYGNINTMLDWILQNKEITNGSKELLNKHFMGFWDKAKDKLDKFESIKSNSDSKYLNQYNRFYQLNKNLITKIKELGIEYEKYHSSQYLIQFINSINYEYRRKNENLYIPNTFYNKFSLPNYFPDKYSEFLKKNSIPPYINDYSLTNVLDLFPFYYPYDFNEIYRNNDTIYIKVINNIIGNPANAQVINPVRTNQNLIYLVTNGAKSILADYIFNITNINFQLDNSNIRDLEDYVPGYDKFKIGYDILINNNRNNIYNYYDILFNNNKINIYKYPNIEYQDIFKPKVLDEWLNELYLEPPYLVNFKNNALNIIENALNLYNQKITIISLHNSKQLFQVLTNLFIKIFIKNIDRFSIDESIDEQLSKVIYYFLTDVKLEGEQKKEYDEFLSKIKTNEKVKIAVVSKHIINYINLFISQLILDETNKLVEQYTNTLQLAYSDEYMRKQLLEIGYKTIKRSLDNIIVDNLDTSIMDDASLNLRQTHLLVPTTNTRIFENKCVNKNMIKKFTEIFGKINLRQEDSNGNTILNKLIDQFNIDAITKLTELDPGLKTFKNHRGENSIDYVHYKIKEIKNEYYKNLDSRIQKYSQVLQNEINSNSQKFSGLSLDESEGLVYNLILHSLYLFNEFIWIKTLEFPGSWSLDDKKKLNELLGIIEKEEDLLIKSFDKNKEHDLENYIKEESNFMIIKEEEIKILMKERDDTNNKIKQFDKATENKLISQESINKIKSELESKQETIQSKIDSLLNLKEKIKINLNIAEEIKQEILMKDGSIDYKSYDNLVSKFKNYYYQVLVLLNKSIKNKPVISNSQIHLISINYDSLPKKNSIDVLISYYSNIINNLYAEFEDFDKYEDDIHNTVNQSMLNIIKINVINVIGKELYNLLIKNMINITEGEKNRKKIVQTESDDTLLLITDDIENILKTSIYIKLGVQNPDSINNNIDILKAKLITDLTNIFGLNPQSATETFNEQFNGFIDFYISVAENISYNIYFELIKLLSSMKKISLLLEILKILMDKET